MRVLGVCVYDCTAGRLPDGRIVCAGTTYIDFSDEESSEEVEMKYHVMAQVLEPPRHGSPSEASWQWRALPGVSVLYSFGGGCVRVERRPLRSLWRSRRQ